MSLLTLTKLTNIILVIPEPFPISLVENKQQLRYIFFSQWLNDLIPVEKLYYLLYNPSSRIVEQKIP